MIQIFNPHIWIWMKQTEIPLINNNIDKSVAKLVFLTLKLPSIKHLLFSRIFENFTKFPIFHWKELQIVIPLIWADWFSLYKLQWTKQINFLLFPWIRIRIWSQQLCHKLTNYDSKKYQKSKKGNSTWVHGLENVKAFNESHGTTCTIVPS